MKNLFSVFVVGASSLLGFNAYSQMVALAPNINQVSELKTTLKSLDAVKDKCYIILPLSAKNNATFSDFTEHTSAIKLYNDVLYRQLRTQNAAPVAVAVYDFNGIEKLLLNNTDLSADAVGNIKTITDYSISKAMQFVQYDGLGKDKYVTNNMQHGHVTYYDKGKAVFSYEHNDTRLGSFFAGQVMNASKDVISATKSFEDLLVFKGVSLSEDNRVNIAVVYNEKFFNKQDKASYGAAVIQTDLQGNLINAKRLPLNAPFKDFPDFVMHKDKVIVGYERTSLGYEYYYWQKDKDKFVAQPTLVFDMKKVLLDKFTKNLKMEHFLAFPYLGHQYGIQIHNLKTNSRINILTAEEADRFERSVIDAPKNSLFKLSDLKKDVATGEIYVVYKWDNIYYLKTYNAEGNLINHIDVATLFSDNDSQVNNYKIDLDKGVFIQNYKKNDTMLTRTLPIAVIKNNK